MNPTRDIKQITSDGIEFENGVCVEAELKIVFPDWAAHPFLQGLPISDDRGFIVTDPKMRNPKNPNDLAAGDASALVVPKVELDHAPASRSGCWANRHGCLTTI
jgi:sulfide:quinone oxidoreductase